MGHDNRFYLVVSDPTGRPAKVDASIILNGSTYTTTDDSGLAVVTHPVIGNVAGQITVTDAAGHTVSKPVTIQAAVATVGQIRLRTDQVVYRAGDTATLTADVSGPIRRIYLDAIRGGQTVWTDAVDVVEGRAELKFDLTEDLVGDVELSAYHVAIYNYLPEPQIIELTLSTQAAAGHDWFTLVQGGVTRQRELAAGEVTVEYFRIRAESVGWRELQVVAMGTAMSDAVARSVEVEPDGQARPW